MESSAKPDILTLAQRRAIEATLDRIEDRLRDAPCGLHQLGPPRAETEVLAAGLDPRSALLWVRWDGLELGHGEATILALADQPAATAAAEDASLLAPGDRVIGERGQDLYVLCADPWAEGGDVVLVDDTGQRAPVASSIERMVLAWLGEMTAMFDEQGEYQEGLFDEAGELTLRARRRMLRRHLDLDPEAAHPRFELAAMLRREGAAAAASSELRRVIKLAPDYAWAHYELGRAYMALKRDDLAIRAFANASDRARDDGLRGYFCAYAALASREAGRTDDQRMWAARVDVAYPGFAAAYESGVREALAAEDPILASEQLELALAVAPGHLGLLSLAPHVRQLQTTQP